MQRRLGQLLQHQSSDTSDLIRNSLAVTPVQRPGHRVTGAEWPSLTLFGGNRALGQRMRMELDHGYLTVAGLNRAAKIIANNDDDIGWIIEIVVHC